jgi:hypothetical protein
MMDDWTSLLNASAMTQASASTDWPVKPFTLGDLEQAYLKLMEVDFPKEIRCSAAYLAEVRRSTLIMPAIVDPLMPHDAFRLDHLPLIVDEKMTGMKAECHWRSGKVDQIWPKVEA